MTPIWAALIGAGVIIGINAMLFSYYYGRVTQKVDDHERRISRLEEWKGTF